MRLTARVPATSANLGPGFDALGLALDLRDELEAEVVADGLTLDVAGEGADDVPRDESGGFFKSVTDEEILSAQRQLAARDGVFVEPASAAGVAGILQSLEAGASYAGKQVVVTVTGHGLKDIDTALSTFTGLVDTVVEADVDAAAEAAGLR